MKKKNNSSPVIIKKYTNRRLYHTQTSHYITLEDVAGMVKKDIEFEVRDAKTGEDLTRAILAQIIAEQEIKGFYLLPIGFLKQIIKLYDDRFATLVPAYLETMMSLFSKEQERLRHMLPKGTEDFSMLHTMEKLIQHNTNVFMEALKLFNPFGDPNKPKK